MNYSELLSTTKWRTKRVEILFRDNFQCKKCDRRENVLKLYKEAKFAAYFFKKVEVEERVHLEVHHKLYRENYAPWAQPNSDLVTLCRECHINTHLTEKIKVIDETEKLTHCEFSRCTRCNGKGYLEQYSHIEGGICFKCRGASILPLYEIEHTKLNHEIDYSLYIDKNELDELKDYLSNGKTKYRFENLIEFLDHLNTLVNRYNFTFYDDRLVPMYYDNYKGGTNKEIQTILGYGVYLKYLGDFDLKEAYKENIPSPRVINIAYCIELDDWLNAIDKHLLMFNNYDYYDYYKKVRNSSVDASPRFVKYKSALLYKLAVDSKYRLETLREFYKPF